MTPTIPMTRPVKLRSFRDRARQVLLYEGVGLVLIAPLFSLASGVAPAGSIGLLALLALISVLWTAAFNTAFDWTEGRLCGRTADCRPVLLRVAYAAGAEASQVLISTPIIAAWAGMPWWEALAADLSLVIAYGIYGFLFSLVYDRIFRIKLATRP